MNALTITGLEKSFGDALRDHKVIDLTVPEDDFFVLPAPDGGGKSTAVGLVCSLINRCNYLEEFFIRLASDKNVKA